jgi:hypothetical protein
MKSQPNPDSDYVSKYLLDFNKRELDKFFHPEKYPKVFLSVAALGVIAFFFVAWMFPLKDQLFNSQFQKQSSYASNEKESQNLTLAGPQSAKVGDEIIVLLTARAEINQISHLNLDLTYSADTLTLVMVKPLSFMNNQSQVNRNVPGKLGIKIDFPSPMQTQGAQQELLAASFKLKKAGRAAITIDDTSNISDQSGQSVTIWKNNYSLLITQ